MKCFVPVLCVFVCNLSIRWKFNRINLSDLNRIIEHPPWEGKEFAKWEQRAKDICACLSSRLYIERGFSFSIRANWISLAKRLCATCQSLIYSVSLFLSQQTAENQTSSSSSSGGAKKTSSSGSSFTNSINRPYSITASDNSGGKVSISDNAGTSISSATKGTSRNGSTKGATKKDRRSSMVSTVEQVSVPSSEKELEEESLNVGVGVPSSSGNASSVSTTIGSCLSSSLEQLSSSSGTDGTTSEWPLSVDLWH